MIKLDSLLTYTLADPLAAARKAANPVGYVGFDLPLDIILAGPQQFCHLPWHKQRPTPQADQWLETAFPGWARSMLEDWINGEFNMFEFVVFSRGDDAAQRLYYYLSELQRRGIVTGPKPLIFDSANIPRDSSIRYTSTAIGNLLRELGIAESALPAGIERANYHRKVFADLETARVAAGHIYENISRASLFCDLAAALEQANLPHVDSARRMLLAGSAPPDDTMHRAAEEIGWNIVGETHQRVCLRHGPVIRNYAKDPATAIAQQSNRCPYGPRSFSERANFLLSEVQRTRAEAVVLWLTEEDESLAWHVPSQRDLLAKHDIPLLILTRQHWDGSDAADDAIKTFLQELSL